VFNWREAGFEEMAWWIASNPPANTANILAYYRKLGEEKMIAKIKAARLRAKKYRVIINADKIKKECNVQ